VDFAVRRLKLRPEWAQKANASRLVHFDLTESKRVLAVMYGAVEVSDRVMVAHMRRVRAGERERV
jgi:hypothetical protein